MAVAPILPARLELDARGIPLSSAFGDVYHSIDGGLEQARHVFLQGNGLPRRWQGRDLFTVLETGFGLGLNFLATWRAWRDDPAHCGRLHFVSVEKHPFCRDDLRVLHRRWPALEPLAVQLHRAWPALTPGFHRLLLDEGQVTLTLLLGDARTLLPSLACRADAVFLDGFAPARNPELWSADLLRRVSRLCAADATLATWCVAGTVRDALAGEGWTLDKAAGFGRKREMLLGRLASRRPVPSRPQRTADEKRALVIGAGIAGCAVAERLVTRGWRIQLVDRETRPAMAASGNPVGLLHPVITSDDNHHARIVRAAHLYAVRLLDRLAARHAGLAWNPRGILQLARDAAQEAEQEASCKSLGFPTDYVRYANRDEASALAGLPLATGGWYYPEGGWISPAAFCRALLEAAGDGVALTMQRSVNALRRTAEGWQALAADGVSIGEAPLVVLANAQGIQPLAASCELPLTKIRGQISLLPAGAVPGLAMALCGNGYVIPEVGGRHCCGATFDLDDDDPAVREDSHRTNLGHLRALLPSLDLSGVDTATLAGRVGFRSASLDRLPLVGPLPDRSAALGRSPPLFKVPRLPDLHALAALGSRGMVLAPLMAELLAARIEGETLPLERTLVDALDPARFLVRRQRHSPPPDS